MTSLSDHDRSSVQDPIAVSPENLFHALENRDREIYALRQQLQALKAHINKLPSDAEPGKSSSSDVTAASLIDPLKLRNDKMMAVLAERERQMKGLQAEYKEYKATSTADLHKEKLVKQSLADELAALHGQLETLKGRFIEGQRNNESIRKELVNVRTELESVRVEKQALISEASRSATLQKQLEEMQENVQKLEQLLNSSKESLQIAEMEREHALRDRDAGLARADALEEKNKSLEKLVESLTIDKAFAQEKIFHLQGEREDAEARLKLAHFHMAKKVKETAELEANLVAFQSKIEELTYDLALSQKMFDDYRQAHEKNIRDDELHVQALKTALEQAQLDAKQWEEKYFIGLDKWRGQEKRIAELVLMEEKMLKMKSLINSYNTPQERYLPKFDKGDQPGGQA